MNRFLLAWLLVFSPLLGHADDEPSVMQKGRAFSVKTVQIEAGGKVRFVNNDNVRHNIAVTSPDGSDATGVVQDPGTEKVLPFEGKGEYKVHCLIHPTMKMTVIAK